MPLNSSGPSWWEGIDDKGNKYHIKDLKMKDMNQITLNHIITGIHCDDTQRIIYSMTEMISDFSLDRVHKETGRFDI